MSLNVRPKRQVTRKSLNEEDLFESINHAIGDDYPKLVISDDYKPMQRVNGRPEYFTEPQIINNEPCIIVKWVGDQECMEKLQTLVNLKEKYLYDLIPWILSNIKPNECESDSIIKEYIDTIWRCTKTSFPIGTFVEQTNGTELEMKYNIGIVVGVVDDMKTEFDFEWNISKYRNTIVKPLDTSNVVLEMPTSPRRYHNRIVAASDLLKLDLSKYVPNGADWNNWNFKEKYMLLQIHMQKERNDDLEMQLHEAHHEAQETYSKQIEIGLERCMADLRVDFDGATKRTNIAFNANFFFLYLKPILEENGIKIHKRGYVHTIYLKSEYYPAVLGLSEADLTVSQEPDAATLSDGYEVKMNDLRLVWSNYTTKLRFEFEVDVKKIPCESESAA